MNTIEGLKLLPSTINRLLEKRDELQLTIDECYKPFRDIIKEVFNNEMSWCYIDDIDIGVSDSNVCFCLRYRSDDECEGTYSYPIEAFVSADVLRKYISDAAIKEQERLQVKREADKLAFEKQRENDERETYLSLKKKFEGA